MSTYCLTHVTTEKNFKSIENTNTFIGSTHSKTTNEWLGDGIYFWDVNDKEAIKLGKKLVKNKEKKSKEKIVSITITMKIDDEKHINLGNENIENQFLSIIKKSPLDDSKLIDSLKSYKERNKFDTKELNKIGYLFGLCVNLYVNVLKKRGYNIDMVSHSFYHNRKISHLYGKEELCYRQFCVKNVQIVNNINSNDWIVEYI